jgi:hypothetical protein
VLHRWCSWCYEVGPHLFLAKHFVSRNSYRCRLCLNETAKCLTCSESMFLEYSTVAWRFANRQFINSAIWMNFFFLKKIDMARSFSGTADRLCFKCNPRFSLATTKSDMIKITTHTGTSPIFLWTRSQLKVFFNIFWLLCFCNWQRGVHGAWKRNPTSCIHITTSILWPETLTCAQNATESLIVAGMIPVCHLCDKN